ncbi:MAG: YdeI/OmpD-associated family protein [Thermoanaerobaculia bacterium]
MADDTAAPTFFETPGDFRRWLQENHETESELIVGFKKKGTGLPSITWPESVDEALCFGWIDGIRRRLDEESYTIRFTPRRPESNWSAVNIRRMGELMDEGRVHSAGRRAFENRTEDRSRTYSYEQRDRAQLDEEMEERFREAEDAWSYFRDEAPWYRKTAIFWVMSAKKQETRERRLGVLIASSRERERIPPLRREPRGDR